jgi:hypothetical protein
MAKTGSVWWRHLFYRRESWRSTWKLRLSVLVVGTSMLWITKDEWTLKIGQSLVCQERIEHSDALLVENFDPDYLIFERSAELEKAQIATRAFVPAPVEIGSEIPNVVSKEIAGVMAGIAHLPNMQVISMQESEPISLNAARQIRDFLHREHVRSIIVVAPGFRSRRSFLVYTTVLASAGITVGCAPVFGLTNVRNWTATWHGIQNVGLQFAKLLYYRLYVLRLYD